MFHSLKRIGLVWVLLFAGARSMYGFALLGPLESWQITAAGFGEAGDDGGPKNISDEYRWNTRYLYYSYDESFLNYFGTNMAAQIDEAFDVFNALTNLSSYDSGLTNWPATGTATTRYNYTAAAMTLLDAKSFTMSVIANMLGLAQPDRYTWNIHDRFLTPPSACPADVNYVVVQRNFDPVTDLPTSYVNGAFYDYVIVEDCGVGVPSYYAQQVSVDPTSALGTAVAAGWDADKGSISYVAGRFYTGLTRDDVGGLRYLMGTNTMNVESVDPNSQLIYTNNSNPQILVTSNLALFAQQALTNNPTNLLALYPGLLITGFTNFFTNVVTTNITAYFYYPPGAPAGTELVGFSYTYTTNVELLYAYTFGNVVTNHYFTTGYVTTSVTNVTQPNGYPAGYLQTNVVNSTTLSSFVNGDFYLIPTNALCGSGYQILSTQLVSVIPITNTFGTNATGTTGITNTQSTAFNVITYFTQYSLVVFPIQCVTNSVELREGMDKIVFIRQDYDSLLGTQWTPVTNTYTLTAITNSAPVVQTFYRVITQPDILIQAKDQIIGPAAAAFIAVYNSLNFNTNNESSDGLGPGTIYAPLTFVYGKGGGPVYYNEAAFYLAGSPYGQIEANAVPFYEWGSFDGSTNAPVVYPSSISLAGLQTQVFFQITSGLLPDGSVSGNGSTNQYNVQLQAQGANPPYTWALDATSAALPGGLSLSSGGVISGSLTGDSPAIYDFLVDATDAVGRVTEQYMFIQVNP